MLNINKHQATYIKILKAIYSNPLLATNLGFKGGTAAYLFHKLPRFSVDLDFDLINLDKKKQVFDTLNKLLPTIGQIKDASDKHYTLFFLLNYEKYNRNIKIEISKRPQPNKFITKSYLGIPMLVMAKPDMTANKLSALLTRKRFASRDLFDVWFFLSNEWPINKTTLEKQTNLTYKQALSQAIKRVKMLKSTRLLHGLGELVNQKQKAWARQKLIQETIFPLQLYKKIS